MVSNWRCIEHVELELSRINIFLGPNSSGKSSLAYALYFFSRSSKEDPEGLLLNLYGYKFDKVVRIVDEKPQYPIRIEIDGNSLLVNISNGKYDVVKPTKVWADEFLLPSRRVDFLHVLMFLPKLLRGIPGDVIRLTSPFAASLFELFKQIPLLPPFGIFTMDYAKAATGKDLMRRLERKISDVGGYVVDISPIFSLIDLYASDPYTGLKLPAELAPDGLLDFAIVDLVLQRAEAGSLVVVEEPEIHKNPSKVIELTEDAIRVALEKNLVVVMTTHTDLIPLAAAKMVGDGRLRVDDVKVYYFTRDPWTKVKELKLYSDGTFEELPDSEKVVEHIF